MKESRVINFCNQKGGTSKTTGSINLGVALANMGKKVLLVDLDSQSSLTISLGFEPEDLKFTLSDILYGRIKDDQFIIEKEKYLLHAEGVDILPSDMKLAGVETAMANAEIREHILKGVIDEFRDLYDFIIIDSLPSLGLLNTNGLTASDSVIIPVSAQYLPMKGMEQLLVTIRRIRRRLNPQLEIEGILVTMFDKRTTLSKEVKTTIEGIYNDEVRIFESVIPISTKIAEAPSQGQSIFSYDPKNIAAERFISLAAEVIRNV